LEGFRLLHQVGEASLAPRCNGLAALAAELDTVKPDLYHYGMHPRASELITRLNLAPHSEGGYFARVFRSEATVFPSDSRGLRAALSAIYFLLVAGTFSRWHRVSSDEAWHHYEGSPLDLFSAPPRGGASWPRSRSQSARISTRLHSRPPSSRNSCPDSARSRLVADEDVRPYQTSRAPRRS
jgi:hypothetical protein